MSEIRVIFHSPGLSKAALGDILESVGTASKDISVDARSPGSELSSDPATVALIGAAGVTVAALIHAATQTFLAKKREKSRDQTSASVLVTVFGTSGKSWKIEINDQKRIPEQTEGLPTDQDEILKIRLE